VEEKVEVLLDTVKQNLDQHSSRIEEEQRELEEVRRRRRNLIIHGLKESVEEEGDKRREAEEGEMMDLLHSIKCDKISVDGMIRLGKRQEDPVNNPRPLRLEVASEEQKERILHQAKNLRDKKAQGWDKIFIHTDLTPKQREKRRLLVIERKRRELAGEKNLIIVNERIVTRRPREEEEGRKDQAEEESGEKGNVVLQKGK